VRNLMKSEEYAQVFDVQLAEDLRRADVGTRRKAAAITRSALAALSTDAERTWC